MLCANQLCNIHIYYFVSASRLVEPDLSNTDTFDMGILSIETRKSETTEVDSLLEQLKAQLAAAQLEINRLRAASHSENRRLRARLGGK